MKLGFVSDTLGSMKLDDLLDNAARMGVHAPLSRCTTHPEEIDGAVKGPAPAVENDPLIGRI